MTLKEVMESAKIYKPYKNRDTFRELILGGNFKKAYFEHAIHMKYGELSNEVVGLGFDVQSIMIYARILTRVIR